MESGDPANHTDTFVVRGWNGEVCGKENGAQTRQQNQVQMAVLLTLVHHRTSHVANWKLRIFARLWARPCLPSDRANGVQILTRFLMDIPFSVPRQ